MGDRGGSRISGGTNILFSQIYLKTAWKRRKLDRGCASKILLCRSATGPTCFLAIRKNPIESKKNWFTRGWNGVGRFWCPKFTTNCERCMYFCRLVGCFLFHLIIITKKLWFVSSFNTQVFTSAEQLKLYFSWNRSSFIITVLSIINKAIGEYLVEESLEVNLMCKGPFTPEIYYAIAITIRFKNGLCSHF